MSQDIYKVLTKKIAEQFKQMKKSNVFYQRLFAGRLTVEELALFISNVSYLTAQTPRHLNLASQVAKAKNLQTLAEFFVSKSGEEVGHEKWGEEDLRQLNKRFGVTLEDKIVLPQMQAHVQANEDLIRRDPYLYFVYILFAEYFTVIAAPECLSAIERLNNVPKEMISIIGKHGELDKEHIHEWAIEAEKVGMDPSKLDSYLRTLDSILVHYDKFCTGLSFKYAKAS